jgi:hypothetical protein
MQMNWNTHRWPLWLVLLPTAILAWFQPDGKGSQPAESAAREVDRRTSGARLVTRAGDKLYFNTSGCGNCHEEGKLKPDGRPKFPYDPVCACNELVRWRTDQKHQNAYNVLSSERSLRMGRALGIEPTGNTGAACTACHGVSLANVPVVDDTLDKSEGVSCAVCHGPYQKWAKEHPFNINPGQRAAWRAKSREDHELEDGMRDVWTLSKRAELCASCHIGNLQQGKFVAHDMYASGHPPLPSIEFSTFAESMRHWQDLKEKSRQALSDLHVTDKSEINFEQTKFVLIGGMVAFREQCRLLDGNMQKDVGDQRLPDLSLFDCYACHHELERPSWRQQAGRSGLPGRPQPHQWPTLLVKLALHQLPDEKAEIEHLNKLEEQMAVACNVQPFGNPMQVAEAAKTLADWADQQVKLLEVTKITGGAAARLLNYLYTLSEQPQIDYDSSRQIAWAFKTIYNELFQVNGDDERQQVVAGLKSLNLDVPDTREVSDGRGLAEDLRVRGQFQPSTFHKQMDELRESLRGRRPPASSR